nr:immunoglobulin light chain junction region [Macaca mulatta]MOY15051.1 immunoglobulin light chain junction region [Macaca mulatta]MOY15644.1 immunoglobulin light chain junction region [Macaca mulatta]MOY15801.1 immunoglobulin light chain junction region [Macaca mulatta]MOY16061.1 immunoglobulin light chain junction region [Macaca mulatta]
DYYCQVWDGINKYVLF